MNGHYPIGWNREAVCPPHHYYRNGESLCGEFVLLEKFPLQQGRDISEKNCPKCQKLLQESKQEVSDEKEVS